MTLWKRVYINVSIAFIFLFLFPRAQVSRALGHTYLGVPSIISTIRSEYEYNYEYEFSVLSTRCRFKGRKFSRCACSELKTRTRSRPRTPIWRSLLTRARAHTGFPRSHIHTLDLGLHNSRNIRICMRKTVIFPSLKYTKKQIWIKTNLICFRCMFPCSVWGFLGHGNLGPTKLIHQKQGNT